MEIISFYLKFLQNSEKKHAKQRQAGKQQQQQHIRNVWNFI